MKRTTLILISMLWTFMVMGQSRPDYTQRLYTAYIEGNMPAWKAILRNMDQDYQKGKNPQLLYELCFAYYGYIGYLISQEKDEAVKSYLEKAMARSDELEKRFRDRPDIRALQGALLGYRIYLSKFSSMYLGPRAMKYIKSAYEESRNCFNCNVEMGNLKFYTPKVLGGSQEEAIGYYEKAVALLQNSRLKRDRDWMYLNTVLLLAHAYKNTGRKDQACRLYEELLEYEPRADWIRTDLYAKCKEP